MRVVVQDAEHTLLEHPSGLDRAVPRNKGQNSNNLGHIFSVPFGLVHRIDMSRTKSTLN